MQIASPTKEQTIKYERELSQVEAKIDKNGFSIETLQNKIDILENLNRNEQALKNCEILLHFDPLNKKCHQTKLKLLKRLRKFKYISKYLNHSIDFFPTNGISNLNLSQKFKLS